MPQTNELQRNQHITKSW